MRRDCDIDAASAPRLGPLHAFVLGMATIAMAFGGCECSGGKAKQRKDTRIAAAINDALAGRTYAESSLRTGTRLSRDELAAAESYVREHADCSGYHLLMAVREQAPDAYQRIPGTTKAKILCDALTKLIFLDDFGILGPGGSYDGGAAKALVEVGRSAVPLLLGLLRDKAEAPLSGSEPATTSTVYGYRRADFAYRYLMLILGRKPTFPVAPIDRDALIADLQRELAAR